LITGQNTQGQAVSARTIDRDEFFDSYTLSLTPRLTWTASECDKIVADIRSVLRMTLPPSDFQAVRRPSGA
jgi:hypothetical protein